nr:MAG TPA: putative peptide chain release factor domain protein [Caudoviricetes sp.]
MTKLKYDARDNTICWETPNSSDFIELRPSENGAAILEAIKALATLPLKADTIVIPYRGIEIKSVKGWRLGGSDITLIKLTSGYSITHRPTGVQIIGGLYKTRAQALDQLPRAVIELSRARNIIANWRTLNF